MSLPLPQPTSRPLPFLPLELKHHILRFCDPSSLAITSRVSLAFLELSSPILYQDIEIVGLKNVDKLFCWREPTLDHPHLHPHLSLSQVRSVAIQAIWGTEGRKLHPSTSRLAPTSSSLPIDLLILRPIGLWDELSGWSSIFPLFNPRSVRVVGHPCSSDDSVPSIDLTGASWSNLVHLYFNRVVSEGYIGTSLSAEDHPPKGLMVMFFDLASIRWDEVDDVEHDLVLELNPEGIEEWAEGIPAEFVVRVSEDSDRERFEDQLRGCWEDDGRLDDFDAFRSRLRFEIASQDSADEQVNQ